MKLQDILNGAGFTLAQAAKGIGVTYQYLFISSKYEPPPKKLEQKVRKFVLSEVRKRNAFVQKVYGVSKL